MLLRYFLILSDFFEFDFSSSILSFSSVRLSGDPTVVGSSGINIGFSEIIFFASFLISAGVKFVFTFFLLMIEP